MKEEASEKSLGSLSLRQSEDRSTHSKAEFFESTDKLSLLQASSKKGLSLKG